MSYLRLFWYRSTLKVTRQHRLAGHWFNLSIIRTDRPLNRAFCTCWCFFTSWELI